MTIDGHGHTLHRPPTQCPVCSSDLTITELGCPSCSTRIGGTFSSCAFCRLDQGDLDALEVFLRSRGNMKEFQSHLGVSYPTARQRYAELMGRLGFGETLTEPDTVDREHVLRELAAGRMSIDDAEAILSPDRLDD